MRPALSVLAAAALTAAVLSACGPEGAGTASDPSPTPSGTPGSTPGRSPGGTGGTPSAGASVVPVAGGPAAEALLPEGELPRGWRYSTRGEDLGVPEMCGVVLEPPALSSYATQRFTRSWEGPFVIQYSFVSSDEAATTERMAQWAQAAATCTSWTTDGVELSVSPVRGLTPVGDDFGAVHAEVEADGLTQQREYVAWRDGPRVHVLVSYGLDRLADTRTLDAMVTAIAR